MLSCSVKLTFSKTDTFRTGNTYVCLTESQLKGLKKAAGNNSRCLVIIIYYFLNISEVLLNKSVCNYELRAFFSRIIHVM